MFWVQDSVLLSLRFVQAIGICAAAVTYCCVYGGWLQLLQRTAADQRTGAVALVAGVDLYQSAVANHR